MSFQRKRSNSKVFMFTAVTIVNKSKSVNNQLLKNTRLTK